ncbi:MAG: hypothetical protein M1832_001849 [Thelocarpon impressellum]|nr:MAG: hypothetical protein M1832_001849 [Thelocarpon impressellum]
MSRDDQYEYFLEVLSSVPTGVKRYSLEVADSIDRHFETVAVLLRETLSSAPWIPDVARPTRPPRPPPPPPMPAGLYRRAQDWVSVNRVLTAAMVASVGATGVWMYRRRRGYGKKRRARRASNGARKEVVVIAGSPSDPITRSLSLDLERRGFIVYVVVSSPDDEQLVHGESRVDIRPLNLDVADALSSEAAIDHFSRLLQTPQHAFPGAGPHTLHLAGVILIPDTTYPSGPISTIAPDLWSDSLNVKVLGTIATTQALLRPIHESRDARVLFLTPSIVASLRPPFHGPEASIVGALEAFASTLRAELRPSGVEVVQVKLGALDHSSTHSNKRQLQPSNAARADVLSWPAAARALYGRDYSALASSSPSSVRGSPMRELHNVVFDALAPPPASSHPLLGPLGWRGRASGVRHVGHGAALYALVGAWAPAGLVGWMLGVRGVPPPAAASSASDDGRAQAPEAHADAGAGTGSVEWERVEGLV